MAIPINEQTIVMSDSICLEYLVSRIIGNLNKTVVIIILTILLYSIYTIALTPNLFSGGDNAHYLVLADALQSGQGYKTISQVSEPFATERPPGLSILLAPLVYSKGLNIPAAKRMVAIWGLLAILATYFHFKQATNPLYALGIAFIFAVMPIVFMYSRRIYAAMPFTSFTFMTFIFVRIYERKKKWLNSHLIFLSACIVLAFYIRTIGIVLLISVVCWLLLKKNYAKATSLTALCTPFIVYWFCWTSKVQQTIRSGYLNQIFQTDGIISQIQLGLANLHGNIRLISENLFYLSSKAPRQLDLIAPIFTFISYATIFIVSIFIVIGFLSAKSISLPSIYLFLYASILLIWPHVIDRFIIPILPLIIHYYIQGITQFCHWLYQRYKFSEKFALLILTGLTLEIILSGLIHIPARLYQEQQFHINNMEMAAFYDVANWAGQNLSQDKIVATQYNNFFYIYSSRRQTVPLGVDRTFTSGISDFFIASPSQDITSTVTPLYCSTISDICIFKPPR